jgi:hypothetical protein
MKSENQTDTVVEITREGIKSVTVSTITVFNSIQFYSLIPNACTTIIFLNT